MRRQSHRISIALLLAVLSLPLTGCDPHDKAWEPEHGNAAHNSGAGETGTAAAVSPGDGDIVVAIASTGAITCKVGGAPIAPLTDEAIAPAGSHLLIVANLSHDHESRYPIAADLQSRGVSSDGRVSLRRLGESLIVESEGAAHVVLSPRNVQDDIDDCVQFAGEDEVGRLAARLDADPSLVDGRDSKTGLTPLARAAKAGCGGTAALLLERRANPAIEDNKGYSALHLAAQAGRLEIVRLLVKFGADVNAPAKDGATPIQLASADGHPEVAAFLTGAGATGGSKLPIAAHRTKVDPGVFELTAKKSRRSYPDGSEIRLRGSALYVLRAGQSDRTDWEQFDLPAARNAWIALQGTGYRVLVRGKGKLRVWASYHPADRTKAE